MKFPLLKSVKCGRFFFSLISIAAISLLLVNSKIFDRTTKQTPLSTLNKIVVSSTKTSITLLSPSDPLSNTDFWYTEEACNKSSIYTIYSHSNMKRLYVNSHRLQQDHPCVIEIIRLHYPSTGVTPLSLDGPDVVDPSAGQSSVVLPYLHNKTEGFFVECGAGDGETLSNTLFMERQLKWKGVLIEADRKFFSQILTKKRQVFALPVCLNLKPYPTEVSFYEDGIAGEIYDEKLTNPEEVMTTNDSFKLANVQCFPLHRFSKEL